MTNWTVVPIFLTLSLILVSASPPAFVENVRDRSGRIVSGWEATEGQFPHQLLIRMVNTAAGVSSCGGTIIHSEWGMTAAHCTAGRPTIVIRAGLLNITRPHFIFETTTWFNHPLYNNNIPSVVQPNDIAILKFNRVLAFGELVQPIRIQPSVDRDRNYGGERLTASGWGALWTNGLSPENMNWVYLTFTTNFECWLAFGGNSIIVDSTICARGYNDTTQSTCQGDSGGPLTVVDRDGIVTQVGISSFVSGLGCHADVPAGFCRPGHYHDWLTEVTGIDFDWQHTPPTDVPGEIITTEAPIDTEAPTIIRRN